MNETEMIEEATQRAMMTPILQNLEADVDYYLDEVRREQEIDRWYATLPDEWDTHKLAGTTGSGIGVCKDDCKACMFRFALKTMPVTVWIGSKATLTDEPLFVTRSKRLAEQIRDTGFPTTPIIITELKVTQ